MVDIPQNIMQDWKIVVVDDEPDSLYVVEYLLNLYQADVYTAANGMGGFELIKSVCPRFVISDLSMPEVNGWMLIEMLQNDPATQDIPVIALTAHALKGDRQKALAAGFRNYLTKPLTASSFIVDLLSALNKIPDFADDLKDISFNE